MNRYSGAVESTIARDFLDLRSWFHDDDAEPSLISDFKMRFRNLELRRETRRGTSVYNGIFNLLVLNGARDWTSGAVPQYGDLDDHHIVPKSWAHGRPLETSIDTILNRTPFTADTSRKIINDRLPNEYLPELAAHSGEATVRATLESHFISPAAFDILLRNPFTAADFEDFVSERQRTFREAIEYLLVKERLALSPPLRELDAQTEAIELALRSLICNALAGNPIQLPPHVRKKIDDRLQTALKKNPGLRVDNHQTLDGKLEYADLRELQDTLTSRALTLLFEAQFASKELLVKRFDQLAELRNGIRHSRQVDDVTRMEGEAAVIRFSRSDSEPRGIRCGTGTRQTLPGKFGPTHHGKVRPRGNQDGGVVRALLLKRFGSRRGRRGRADGFRRCGRNRAPRVLRSKASLARPAVMGSVYSMCLTPTVTPLHGWERVAYRRGTDEGVHR